MQAGGEQAAVSAFAAKNRTEELERTIAIFKDRPVFAKAHEIAQRKYSVFCQNRTAELYTTFFDLVGFPDLSTAKHVSSFTGNVPLAGAKNARPHHAKRKTLLEPWGPAYRVANIRQFHQALQDFALRNDVPACLFWH